MFRPPPRRFLQDLYYSSVSLLLHCDGSNGGTTFTDNGPSARSPTSVSAGTTTKNGGKFNQYVDFNVGGGGADFLNYGSNAAFNFGSGDFTIEYWAQSQNSSDGDVMSTNTSGSVGELVIDQTSSQHRLAIDGSTALSAGAMTNFTWYFIAFSRVGNTLYAFRDGALIGNTSVTGKTAGVTTFHIGAASGRNNIVRSLMDEIRITKGVGRYSSAFTAPTAAFPNHA